MSKEIVVNVGESQTRIAIVEDGKLAELYIEDAENKRTIGNLYLGRIRKVMPSIQAAFVDIGQEQDAFLHFSDLSDNLPYLIQYLDLDTPKVEAIDVPEGGKDWDKRPSDLLNRGQEILVQITKEPISNKGSRISTDLSLAGRFLVLVPLQNYVAVSRKITVEKERRRLKALANSLVPQNFGVIVRTVAEDRDAKSLDKDLKLLMERWRRVENRLQEKPDAPALVHEDVDMASSIIRDQFSEEYDRLLVDHESLYHSIRSYVRAVAPGMISCVELHDGDEPVFEAAGIQQGADRAFKDRVELPSGGYLFIEQTEAMHVVDVNSGRSGKGKSQAENSLSVNLEAARVIARQIRLRDLGGIIVVDFIDLRNDDDKKKVYNELKEGFEDDRAITKVLPMSDFGLVEITRQRLRPSLMETNFEHCRHCEGTGSIRSVESSALFVLRAVEEEGIRRRSSEVTVTVPSAMLERRPVQCDGPAPGAPARVAGRAAGGVGPGAAGAPVWRRIRREMQELSQLPRHFLREPSLLHQLLHRRFADPFEGAEGLEKGTGAGGADAGDRLEYAGQGLLAPLLAVVADGVVVGLVAQVLQHAQSGMVPRKDQRRAPVGGGVVVEVVVHARRPRARHPGVRTAGVGRAHVSPPPVPAAAPGTWRP